jgi:hypothetical protein
LGTPRTAQCYNPEDYTLHNPCSSTTRSLAYLAAWVTVSLQAHIKLLQLAAYKKERERERERERNIHIYKKMDMVEFRLTAFFYCLLLCNLFLASTCLWSYMI